jgi:hypothetical protein
MPGNEINSVTKNEEESTIHEKIGFLVASTFTFGSYMAPLWLITSALLVLTNPTSRTCWVVSTPVVISALFPPVPSRTLFRSAPLQCVLKYFDYKEILETSPEELEKLVKEEKVIFCGYPHGVISVSNLCCAISWSKTWFDPTKTPLAVADYIMYTPVLKHLYGAFGSVSVSASSLRKTLNSPDNQGVILYPGGTAEIFLADPDRESIAILNRKGFVRFALTEGCTLVPMYMFGNTRIVKAYKSSVLTWISNKTGIPLTYFYGKFFLPLPLKEEFVAVVGKPIRLPSTSYNL